MTIELTVAISIACAVLGGCVGVLGYRRNRNRDIAEAAKNDAVVLTEIGYIKANTDDIKRKQDRHDEKYLEMSQRVTTVEASTKQAHKRIDQLVDKDK